MTDLNTTMLGFSPLPSTDQAQKPFWLKYPEAHSWAKRSVKLDFDVCTQVFEKNLTIGGTVLISLDQKLSLAGRPTSLSPESAETLANDLNAAAHYMKYFESYLAGFISKNTKP